MPADQEEKVPAYLLSADGDAMGLDIVSSWLSDNNKREFCDFLTEYSTDQAALLFSCSKFLRKIVREGRAEKKPLIQATCIADTLHEAYENNVCCSTDDFDNSEMFARAKAIVQKIREEVNSRMEKSEATGGHDDSVATDQQDETNGGGVNDDRSDGRSDAETEGQQKAALSFTQVMEVSAEIKVDQRHVLNEFTVEHTATLLTAYTFAANTCEIARSGGGDVSLQYVERLVRVLRSALSIFLHRLPDQILDEARRSPIRSFAISIFIFARWIVMARTMMKARPMISMSRIPRIRIQSQR